MRVGGKVAQLTPEGVRPAALQEVVGYPDARETRERHRGRVYERASVVDEVLAGNIRAEHDG